MLGRLQQQRWALHDPEEDRGEEISCTLSPGNIFGFILLPSRLLLYPLPLMQ